MGSTDKGTVGVHPGDVSSTRPEGTKETSESRPSECFVKGEDLPRVRTRQTHLW